MKKIEQQEYKKIILEILKYIDSICRMNNIHYSLLGGSLLGAVREHGIIPWDDDIDIIMEENEFKKLEDIINKENGYYKIINHLIDSKMPITFSKLIDTRTKVIETRAENSENYGAYVDIFIKYNCPNNYFLRRIFYNNLRIKQSLISGYSHSKEIKQKEKGLKKIRTLIASKMNVDKLIKSYYKTIKKYNNKNKKYALHDLQAYGFNKDIIENKWFEEYIDIAFEDMKAMSIKECNKLLERTFGEDYMTPPPKDKQVSHEIEAYWREDF